MAEIEIEGKTVEEAIREGLKQLNCSREQVEVKILDEGTSGLFGLMGAKPARVMVTMNVPGESAGGADLNKTQDQLKEIIRTILKHMGINCTDVVTEIRDCRVYADIQSTESSLLIGKNGQTLEALEHIINLMLARDPATRTKTSIDTERYRRQQEERLQTMATKAVDQVVRSGRLYRFDPMSSRDRKIIHTFLKDNPDVETFSEGDGPFRKVGIKPRKK